MTHDEGVAVLLACIEAYEAAVDEPLRENLGYAEVIGAITAALLGNWEDATLQ